MLCGCMRRSELRLQLAQPCAQGVDHLIDLVHAIPANRLGEVKLLDVMLRQWPGRDTGEGVGGCGLGHEPADPAHDSSGGKSDQQDQNEQEVDDHDMIVSCLTTLALVATSACATTRSSRAIPACWRSSTARTTPSMTRDAISTTTPHSQQSRAPWWMALTPSTSAGSKPVRGRRSAPRKSCAEWCRSSRRSARPIPTW